MSAVRSFRTTRFGLPGVTQRSLGIPTAAYPGRVATNSDLIVAVDSQQTALLLPLTPAATSMTVFDASQIVPYNLLSIDNEIVKTSGPPTGNVVPISRGFDGTAAASHSVNALVLGLIDAWHHNALVSEIEAIETALGPNLSRIPSASSILAAAQFDFTPQTPGGVLNVGTNSILLSPVPLGVSGSNQNQWLYISGGTGTAEAVPITGGTAIGGGASGTVFVTCANAHSGAWTIRSATGGIREAVLSTSRPGMVVLPASDVVAQATTYLDRPVIIQGQSIGASRILAGMASADVFRIASEGVRIADLYIGTDASVASRTGNGIYWDSSGILSLIDHVQIQDQAIGIDSYGAGWIVFTTVESCGTGLRAHSNETHVEHSQFNGNTQYGVWIAAGTGHYFTDVTSASNTITDWYGTGNIADIFLSNCTASVSTSGPLVDFSAVATLVNFTWNGGLVEIAQGANPAFKFGNLDGLALTGLPVSIAGSGSAIQFGAQAFRVLLTGCQFVGSPGTSAVALDFTGSNGAWVTITGNDIRSWGSALTVSTGLLANGFIFTPNYVDVTNPVIINGSLTTASSSLVIQPNHWGNSVPPSYPAAAAVVVKAHETLVKITGTAVIATLGDAWIGRQLTVVFTDPAPGGLSASGNVALTRTVVQNQAVTLQFDGAKWY